MIFNQIPLEEAISRLNKENDLPKEESNKRVLEELYLPIFDSGLVKRFYFINRWQSSYGSRWERQKAKQFGIEMVDLPHDFLKN